ncbi:MAG: tyrosine--tRNA ligase, partial [Solobacterium sp.]|nr:tyrosine--tRNA ligase [Solobacterium sp.]
MNFIEELEWRGLVKDCTDREGLEKQLEKPTTIYCGFDPTADSLHVGHLQQILLLRRYQKAGHQPIALCGGFTGMIGDPRPTTERKLLTHEEVLHNAECIRDQLAHFLSFEGENAAIMENNNNWLGSMTLLDYLRDYGKLFNVSYMLQKDTIKKRLDSGISYTEFSYMILQAIDWLQLYKRHNCLIQIGGSDQWGNLTTGTELIRKVVGDNTGVFGITSPLITRSDGSKFGKSEGKNIWLDPKRTNAYEFYQFWVNTPDSDIIDYLKRLSFASPETIMEIEAKMAEYNEKYTMATDNIAAVEEQAKYEVALEKFIAKNQVNCFTDNFQDLHGLNQLPGIAAQNLMAKGIGFGPEGDYKISAFSAVLMKMAEGREGATGFIEDYTYDLTPGKELELASHMLEVPPSFAAGKPEIQVHHLGIGGKSDPARLVFDGCTGDGIQVTLIDLGDHFRIICADIELVKQPKPMPKLPVARIMYRHKPNFEIGTAAWCYAG